MNDLAVRLPGRIVFGRAHFEDGRQSVNTADLMFPHPWEPHTLGALGLRLRFAGSPPWMAARALPGVPFGSAVAATLPRAIMEEVLRGHGGRAFTDLEVADFLRPVLDSISRSERILAGVAAPPSADPVYTIMSPAMLPLWRFIAGDDRAEPLFSGALEYLALRVFTPTEFAFVDMCGGRLRPMPAAENADKDQYRSGGPGRPSSVHLAKQQMRKRHAEGQMLTSLLSECCVLVEWLKREHPTAPTIKPKSLSEAIRADYRGLCQKP